MRFSQGVTERASVVEYDIIKTMDDDIFNIFFCPRKKVWSLKKGTESSHALFTQLNKHHKEGL